jgi:hypothetical protein
MATSGGPGRFPVELVAEGGCGGLAGRRLWGGGGGLDLTDYGFRGGRWCRRDPGEGAGQVADDGVERWIGRRLAIGHQVGHLRARSASAAGARHHYGGCAQDWQEEHAAGSHGGLFPS